MRQRGAHHGQGSDLGVELIQMNFGDVLYVGTRPPGSLIGHRQHAAISDGEPKRPHPYQKRQLVQILSAIFAVTVGATRAGRINPISS